MQTIDSKYGAHDCYHFGLAFFHLWFWPNLSKLQTRPLNCLNSPAQINWFNIRSFVSIVGKAWQVSGILGEKNLAINFNSHTEPESQSESITAIINHFEKWQTHKHKDRASMLIKFSGFSLLKNPTSHPSLLLNQSIIIESILIHSQQ